MLKCNNCEKQCIVDVLNLNENLHKRNCSDECEEKNANVRSKDFDNWLRNWRFQRLIGEGV